MTKKNRPDTYRDHYYHISRLGNFSMVHIMRPKPAASDPKVSLCESIRSFKAPHTNSQAEAERAIDNLIDGKIDRIPSSHTAFPLFDRPAKRSVPA